MVRIRVYDSNGLLQPVGSGGGGVVPTGTGFTHITGGVQDAVAKLVDTADINPNQVTLAKLAQVATATILGRVTAATGDVEELTGTEATTLLDEFTSTEKGLAPLSGGGSVNFLCADGTWSIPPGSSGPVPTGTGFRHVTAGVEDGAAQLVLTADITNDNVTYAKIQNVSATDRLLGRDTAGAGDIEELTATGGIEFTGTGIQRSALTGDVTATAGSNTTAIASGAVTLAKLANIATNSLIGRDTAGSGVPEAILLNATLEMDGALNLQRAALAGDVTATAGSNTTAIAADAVTFAKMQNIATDSLIGRDTASTGDPENITLNATLSMTGSGALQRAALTGDVTATAGSNATVVANCELTALDITGGSQETVVSPWDDYLALYDGSAVANKKMRWYDLAAKSTRNFARFTSDYAATAGNDGVQIQTSGAGAAVSLGTGTVSHPGVLALETGTTTTGRAGLTSGPASFCLGGGRARYTIIAQVPTLSTALEEFIARWGMSDSISSAPTDGVFFRYERGSSGNFVCVCRSNGTETTIVTGTAVAAATWYRLEAEINAAGTSVEFFIDGSSKGTTTTNIPINAGRELGISPGWVIKSAGTTNRTTELDLSDYIFELSTQR